MADEAAPSSLPFAPAGGKDQKEARIVTLDELSTRPDVRDGFGYRQERKLNPLFRSTSNFLSTAASCPKDPMGE